MVTDLCKALKNKRHDITEDTYRYKNNIYKFFFLLKGMEKMKRSSTERGAVMTSSIP